MRPHSQKALEAFEQRTNQLLSSARAIYGSLETAAESADGEQLEHEAQRFATALESVASLYPPNLWPSWLSQLRGHATQLVSNPGNSAFRTKLVTSIFMHKATTGQFDWSMSDTDFSIDVGQIIVEELDAYEVEKKFEELIKELTEIISSGKIEDQKIYDDLSSVLSMVRAAKVGNFGEKLVTWQFTRRFLMNWAIECGKAVPGIQQSLTALEKTANELDIDIHAASEKAVERIHDRISQNLHSEMPIENVATLMLADQSKANEPDCHK